MADEKAATPNNIKVYTSSVTFKEKVTKPVAPLCSSHKNEGKI